ncbi:MAG TPA: hypothetical protein VMD25_06950 [Acidobacteriaceae bacterium]|nr:hypothetical protein [Acidobacteriaceae bacterium]
MSVNPVQLTFRVGAAWALLNLAAALFFSALFAVEQMAAEIVQRRVRQQHGRAPVVSISDR